MCRSRAKRICFYSSEVSVEKMTSRYVCQIHLVHLCVGVGVWMGVCVCVCVRVCER